MEHLPTQHHPGLWWKVLLPIGVVVVLGLLAVWGLMATSTPNSEGEQIYCTADAMQCPDGSYVGRSGPNCEFVCP